MSARDPNQGDSRLGERPPRGAVATSDASTIIGESPSSGAPPPGASALPIILPLEVVRCARRLAGSRSTPVSSYHVRAPSGEPAMESTRAAISGFFRRRPTVQDAPAQVEQQWKAARELVFLGATAVLLALATPLHVLLPGC